MRIIFIFFTLTFLISCGMEVNGIDFNDFRSTAKSAAGKDAITRRSAK